MGHTDINFNPHSPHRERLFLLILSYHFKKFQSSLPSQGATKLNLATKRHTHISIHAPLTGSDASEPNGVGTSNISIHAPLTGSDTIGCTLCQHFFIFQSTLPSQGATCASRICKNISCDFNPRSPHRERRTGRASMPTVHGISIHAPLTGSDHYRTWIYGFITKFQSTLPSQGATAFGGKVEF